MRPEDVTEDNVDRLTLSALGQNSTGGVFQGLRRVLAEDPEFRECTVNPREVCVLGGIVVAQRCQAEQDGRCQLNHAPLPKDLRVAVMRNVLRPPTQRGQRRY